MTLPIQEDEIQKELDIICGNHVIMHSSEIKKRVSALIAKARIDELEQWFDTYKTDLEVVKYTVSNSSVRKRIKELKDGDE